MPRTGKFKCPQCDRTFSMAPHLGRHLSTIHGVKGKKAAKKPRPASQPGRGRVARTAPPQPRTTGAGIAGAIRELGVFRNTLAAERDRIDVQIPVIAGVLSALDASASAALTHAAGQRPSARKGSLKEFIERVVRAHRGPMAVKDVTTAVLKAGYKSRDKTLRHSVHKLLAAMPHVAKVARGQYQLRA
jgi:hypothetical protein